jgi:NAD(P)-dependent dehydrogenase (short-subunit alcohol dehydrogenase family)
LDIHLVGNLRLANVFPPHLKASKGCLINIGSMYSYFGSPYVPAYGAAKTAMVSLTKSLAIAFAEDGMRVNAIAPGLDQDGIITPCPRKPGIQQQSHCSHFRW